MVWSPANYSATCAVDPSACHPSVLAFMAFLVQHFSHSADEYFTDKNKNDQKNSGNEEYDFIIVGAGSAGCVLANRLSEVEDWRILLLEAGDEEPMVANVPAFHKFISGSSIDWNYKTQPQSNACGSFVNKSCSYSSGKVMGGSSSTNLMYYSRGNKYDYDNWAKLGNAGWSYNEVLDFFKKSEDNRDHDIFTNNSKFHATGGYLTVERFRYVDKNLQTLLDAWKELGYEQIDYTADRQIGFNRAQFTGINGARQSTNGAFVRPVRGRRSNLIIKSNSPATKIIIDPVTKKATGVEYSLFNNKTFVKRVYAKKEVIISAGVLNSPKLLMLSGIGKTSELNQVGIKIIKDLPVGDNFQDHININPFTVIFENSSTIVNISDVKNDATCWMSTHEGILSSLGSPTEISGYIRTSYEKNPEVSDVLVMTESTIVTNVEKLPNNFSAIPYPRPYYNAMNIKLKLLSVKSKGTIKLDPNDPTWGAPLIQPNYFSNSTDLQTMIEATYNVQKFMKTKAFKNAGIRQHKIPQVACKHLEFESIQYFECLAKNYTQPGLHGVGSCKMGPKSDPEAVVNSKLKVYGIKGLRVIDASVMPVTPRGNTNAPTIMIAEKGSDMIKEDWLKST